MLSHTPLKRTCLPIPPHPHIFFYVAAALVPQQQDLLYRLFSALSIPKIKFRTLLASALIFIMQAVVNGDSQGAEEGGIVVVIDNQFIGIAP